MIGSLKTKFGQFKLRPFTCIFLLHNEKVQRKVNLEDCRLIIAIVTHTHPQLFERDKKIDPSGIVNFI